MVVFLKTIIRSNNFFNLFFILYFSWINKILNRYIFINPKGTITWGCPWMYGAPGMGHRLAVATIN